MASIEIIKFKCALPDCTARATRRVRKGDGSIEGDYCSKHGMARLVELGNAEAERGRA